MGNSICGCNKCNSWNQNFIVVSFTPDTFNDIKSPTVPFETETTYLDLVIFLISFSNLTHIYLQ